MIKSCIYTCLISYCSTQERARKEYLHGCKTLLLPAWLNPDQSIVNQLFPNINVYTQKGGRIPKWFLTNQEAGGGIPGSILPLSCVGNRQEPIVDTAFSYEQNWSSTHFCRIYPKGKGSSLQIICYTHTVILLLGHKLTKAIYTIKWFPEENVNYQKKPFIFKFLIKRLQLYYFYK